MGNICKRRKQQEESVQPKAEENQKVGVKRDDEADIEVNKNVNQSTTVIPNANNESLQSEHSLIVKNNSQKTIKTVEARDPSNIHEPLSQRQNIQSQQSIKPQSNQPLVKQLTEQQKVQSSEGGPLIIGAQSITKSSINSKSRNNDPNGLITYQSKRPPPLDGKSLKKSNFFSVKYLPINIRREYAKQFHNIPRCPDTNDQSVELMMTLNMARMNPIYFSNNVLEQVRQRMHLDKHYNSFSSGIQPTNEGIQCVDSLISLICKQKQLQGLEWNYKIAELIDVNDVKRIDLIMSTIESAQYGEQEFLRQILWNECDFSYEHLYVFFDFRTPYGFEIACNLLRDDGNQEKEQRRILLSSKLSSMAVFHEKHITGHMITYMIVTSKEITKEEYYKIALKKAEKKGQALPREVTPLPEIQEESGKQAGVIVPPIHIDEQQELSLSHQLAFEKTNRTVGLRESHNPQTQIPPSLIKEDLKNRNAVTPLNRLNPGTKDSLENAQKNLLRQPTTGYQKRSEIDGLTEKLKNYDMNSVQDFPQGQNFQKDISANVRSTKHQDILVIHPASRNSQHRNPMEEDDKSLKTSYIGDIPKKNNVQDLKMTAPLTKQQVAGKFYQAEENTSQKTLKSEPRLINNKSQSVVSTLKPNPHATKVVQQTSEVPPTDPYNGINDFTFNRTNDPNNIISQLIPHSLSPITQQRNNNNLSQFNTVDPYPVHHAKEKEILVTTAQNWIEEKERELTRDEKKEIEQQVQEMLNRQRQIQKRGANKNAVLTQ